MPESYGLAMINQLLLAKGPIWPPKGPWARWAAGKQAEQRKIGIRSKFSTRDSSCLPNVDCLLIASAKLRGAGVQRGADADQVLLDAVGGSAPESHLIVSAVGCGIPLGDALLVAGEVLFASHGGNHDARPSVRNVVIQKTSNHHAACLTIAGIKQKRPSG